MNTERDKNGLHKNGHFHAFLLNEHIQIKLAVINVQREKCVLGRFVFQSFQYLFAWPAQAQ